MERSHDDLDRVIRRLNRRRLVRITAAEAARDLRHAAWTVMVFRPLRRALARLWFALTAHVDAPARESCKRSSS